MRGDGGRKTYIEAVIFAAETVEEKMAIDLVECQRVVSIKIL